MPPSLAPFPFVPMRIHAALILCLVWLASGLPVRADEKVASESLRVLSYNIHMWQIGVKDLASVIRAADADVVGLNEAWNEQRNEEIARELGYHVVYGGQNPEARPPRKPHTVNGYYMPQVLLTRHKVVESRCFNAMAAKEHPAFDPEVPIYRGGLLAVLETASGTRFVVFVLHLHPWGDGENEKMTSMRLAEMKGVLRKLEGYRNLPILIIGDFNTRSHLDEKGGWKTTKELAANGFSDLYRALHPDGSKNPGLTCGDGRIDYIFSNNKFRAIECRVLEKGVFGCGGYAQSDHLGVFGVLEFKDGAEGEE